MQNFVYITLAIAALTVAFVGARYVRLANDVRRQKKRIQSHVKKHMKLFGTNDRGASMDGQKIFVVSVSDLGL